MNQQHARQGKDGATPADEIRGESRSDDGQVELNEWLQRALAQHEHGLVRYAQQFVGDLERARDVAQDAFVKLCQRAQSEGRLEGSHLAKWLYKVCRNRAIDVARKEKRMKSATSSQLNEQLDSGGNAPDASILAQERQETLVARIADLTQNQQEVLRLKFHGGLSYQEIAEVTGLTKTNVGFLLHTAITKLRRQVATNE